MKIKAIVSEKTIVLKLDGEQINIQKKQQPEIFEKVMLMIAQQDEKALTEWFTTHQKRIEEKSGGVFTVQNGKLVLKADPTTPIPKAIQQKLFEMDRNGEDFLPLIRFWKKLRLNPNPASRADLYEFMQKNKIPLTEQGDIVVEKGVAQKSGALIGELVDCYSGRVDNSVGMIVEMPRTNVDSNNRNECSNGLHVAAPQYVRKWYHNNIVVECIVNPTDVVSVPKDYNATKMRVCRYQVMGYSEKTRTATKVVKLSDFVTEMPDQFRKNAEASTQSETSSGKHVDTVTSTPIKQADVKGLVNPYEKMIDGKTAKEIIALVEELTGEVIELSLKNKQGIIRKALMIFEAADLDLNDTKSKDLTLMIDRSSIDAKKFIKKNFQDAFSKRLEWDTFFDQATQAPTLLLRRVAPGKATKMQPVIDQFNEKYGDAVWHSDFDQYANENVIDLTSMNNDKIKALVKQKTGETISKFTMKKYIPSKAAKILTAKGYYVRYDK